MPMPTRVSASRSSCCVAVRGPDRVRAPRSTTAGGAASTTITCSGSGCAERPSPITASHERSAACSGSGAPGAGSTTAPANVAASETSERARAQAAAARHDPLRVHDPDPQLPGGLSPRAGCARRRRARGTRAAPGRGARERRGADHRGVVDAQRGRQQAEAARRGARRRRRGRSRSAPLAATPPTTASAARPVASSAASARSTSCRTIAAWIARREVGARLGEPVAELAHAAQERGLEPREREIVAGLPAQHQRERKAPGIAVRARRARARRPRPRSGPSSRAPLSNASPAASSRVPPRRTGAA